jgi:hypothetical protein
MAGFCIVQGIIQFLPTECLVGFYKKLEICWFLSGTGNMLVFIRYWKYVGFYDFEHFYINQI